MDHKELIQLCASEIQRAEQTFNIGVDYTNPNFLIGSNSLC
jgi:hypothetical protein